MPCYAVQVPEGPRPNQAVVLVLFGTEYGFSKEVAERLCSELGRLDDGLYWWVLQLWLRQQCDCELQILCRGRLMRAATSVSAAACCVVTQHTIMNELSFCYETLLTECTTSSPQVGCHCESKVRKSGMPHPGHGPANFCSAGMCYMHNHFAVFWSNMVDRAFCSEGCNLAGEQLADFRNSAVLSKMCVPVPQAQAGRHGRLP